MRIIREMRDATNGAFPRLAIWENVPGALTSNKGADFGVVLDEMAESGAVAIEWAVLDAQYFGVPQRRRRVFVCALFDTGAAERSPTPVLPVREGVRRHSQKGNKKKQDASREVEASIVGGSGEGTGVGGDGSQLDFGAVSGDSSFRMRGFGDYVSDETASSIKARDGKDATDLVVSDASSFTATSFAKYVEGVGTLRAAGGDLGGGSETLVTYEKEEAMVFHPHRQDGVRMQGDTVNTLTAFMGTGGLNTPMVAQAIGFSHTQCLDAQPSEVAFPTLRTGGAGHAVAHVDMNDGLAMTLRSGGDGGVPSSRGENLVIEPQAYDEYNDKISDNGIHHSLRAGTKQSNGVIQNMVVRRLMPSECEALMGWPKDHTRWTDDGKELSDTHRYKQCGNGVAAPVAQWIAEKYGEVLAG
jgi:DNA (cytosine-5)-methyltransferase 1